jgi:hypothetical protein
MTKEAQADRIRKDPDYIHCPKMKNSLKEFCDKHPEGVDDDTIARVLMMSRDEVSSTFTAAVSKLQTIMRVR